MKLVEKIFALRRLPLFAGLPLGELAKVAEVARERRYEPGQTVVAAGKPLNRLVLVVGGGVATEDGRRLPEVIGLDCLLFDLVPDQPLVADAEHGASCLVLSKSHLLTTVYEGTAVAARLLECFAGYRTLREGSGSR